MPLLKMDTARNAKGVFFKGISQQNEAQRHGWIGVFALNNKKYIKVFSLWCTDDQKMWGNISIAHN